MQRPLAKGNHFYALSRVSNPSLNISIQVGLTFASIPKLIVIASSFS